MTMIIDQYTLIYEVNHLCSFVLLCKWPYWVLYF